MVLDKGFAWGRPNLGSLSQVAKAVTGTSWNGYRFFGLHAVGQGQILDLALARAVKHAGPLARAISSAVEHSLHTGGVAGSIPASPTTSPRQTDAVSRAAKTIAIPVG